MSIIHDALKKIEQSRNLKVGADKEEKHFKFIFKKIYLLYLLMVCVGVIMGNLFFSFLSQPQNTLPERAKPLIEESLPGPTEALLQETETLAPIDTKKKFEESLVLNGIFFSQDEGCAIINNRIVKQGDLIKGATVKRIGLDEVELEFEGLTIKLSTNK